MMKTYKLLSLILTEKCLQKERRDLRIMKVIINNIIHICFEVVLKI